MPHCKNEILILTNKICQVSCFVFYVPIATTLFFVNTTLFAFITLTKIDIIENNASHLTNLFVIIKANRKRTERELVFSCSLKWSHVSYFVHYVNVCKTES